LSLVHYIHRHNRSYQVIIIKTIIIIAKIIIVNMLVIIMITIIIVIIIIVNIIVLYRPTSFDQMVKDQMAQPSYLG